MNLFKLEIGNSYFMLTSQTPFTSETKWQNFLYDENIENKNYFLPEVFLFV